MGEPAQTPSARPETEAAPRPAAALPLGWLLAAAALALAAHATSLGNPFVYDDRVTVLENPSLRSLTNWRWLLGYSLFRPVVNVSYALDWAAWGARPAGFHLTGLALHAAATGLLFALVWLAARDLARSPARARATAFWTAALFAVHPLLTEAVQYVSARSELLCAAFSLASLLALRRAARGGGARWTAAGTGLLLLALASKEVAAVVPLLALALDRATLPAAGRGRRLARVHLFPLLLVAAGLAARLWVFVAHEAGEAGRGAAANALVQVKVLWRYAALLAWPSGQSLVHDVPPVAGASDPWFVLAALALALLLAGAWALRRRAPLASVGVVWWVLALLPSGLVPLVEPMSEHRTYFAAAGLLLAAAEAGTAAGAALAGVERTLGLLARGAAALAVVALAVAAGARNRVWSDPERLWQDAARAAPRAYGPRFEVANARRAKGDCAGAIPEYRAAIDLAPEIAGAWINLGICSAQTGDLEEAEVALRRALVLQPASAQIHYNLGQLAQLRGDRAAARGHFEQALRLSPGHELSRRALAALPP